MSSDCEVGGYDNNGLSLEMQVTLLKHDMKGLKRDVEKNTDKVNNLEKSEAVTKEQLTRVFDTLDELKGGQDMILEKLDEKDREDKEALKTQIKQNREIKVLVLGSIISALASILIPLFLVIPR